MSSPPLTNQETLDKIAAAYRSPPWWYDVRGFFVLTLAYRGTLWSQVPMFGRHMGPEHLDVGVGSGTLLAMELYWRERQGLPKIHVVGVDYSESMLAGAIQKFRGKNVELHHADVASMPFESARFDTANIANTIHCFHDVDAGLREVFRVLKPGGTVLTNVLLFARGGQPLRAIAEAINKWGQKKGLLYTPYAVEDIRSRITDVGFEITDGQIVGNIYNVTARKAV